MPPAAGLWELGSHDKLAELTLQLIDAVDGADPAAAHSAQIGRPAGIHPVGPVKLFPQNEIGPQVEEVHVMGVADHRPDLRARRARADLRDRDRAIRASEPFHVAEGVLHPECRNRLWSDAVNLGILRC